MTKEQIDEVLARVRTWPIERQEDAARMLMMMEEIGLEPYVLSDEERADIDEALAEVERGEVASNEEVAALLDRLRQR